ncbi:transcriptional regulator, ArsR family [Methanosarcina horonobensis HB-1 = JCM 15518]|uniref:Transcriptional regulator, ArsR family n=1 Tax=Methanosarcina horonobensis HB-1 = JCM 15518 TaxID=1434110 RepID=A0A0E3SD86_9EURY|nr:hypothetical protein [Methanosarcina horonobensis]AKB78037.1 transcriptional regulator, ArsR family [Methanosarcina horonobensis HB-1 = JCM 15518]
MASGIADSFVTIGTINKFRYFWSTHYIERIPDPLLKEIGCLMSLKSSKIEVLKSLMSTITS